jgi:hypothetical protein
MNTNTLLRDQYWIGTFPTPLLFKDSIGPQEVQNDSVGEPGFEVESLPLGPEVQFEVEELTFDTLVLRLVELEREHGMSSLELFSAYLSGAELHSDLEEEWLNLFILFLGTREVRHFSCP